MPTLIFGLLVLVAALWVLGVISRVDPKVAARVMKAAGGILAIGFAAFLGLRGEIFVAVPLGLFGLGLLGWIPFGMTGFTQRTQKSAGQTSRVRSAFLEMELDHDSGAMRGRVTAGRHWRSISLRSFARCWPIQQRYRSSTRANSRRTISLSAPAPRRCGPPLERRS